METENRTWKDKLQHAVIRVAVRRGSPVSLKPDQWGWIAEDYQELRAHMSTCSPDFSRSRYQDTEWTEFAGTFSDDRVCTGLEATVTCVCGQVQDRRWLYREGYAELIRAITDV